jgi:hypothetical protein
MRRNTRKREQSKNDSHSRIYERISLFMQYVQGNRSLVVVSAQWTGNQNPHSASGTAQDRIECAKESIWWHAGQIEPYTNH